MKADTECLWVVEVLLFFRLGAPGTGGMEVVAYFENRELTDAVSDVDW